LSLDAKADMPYNEMWRIYSEAKEHPSLITARKMHDVAKYCIIAFLIIFQTRFAGDKLSDMRLITMKLQVYRGFI